MKKDHRSSPLCTTLQSHIHTQINFQSTGRSVRAVKDKASGVQIVQLIKFSPAFRPLFGCIPSSHACIGRCVFRACSGSLSLAGLPDDGRLLASAASPACVCFDCSASGFAGAGKLVRHPVCFPSFGGGGKSSVQPGPAWLDGTN